MIYKLVKYVFSLAQWTDTQIDENKVRNKENFLLNVIIGLALLAHACYRNQIISSCQIKEWLMYVSFAYQVKSETTACLNTSVLGNFTGSSTPAKDNNFPGVLVG